MATRKTTRTPAADTPSPSPKPRRPGAPRRAEGRGPRRACGRHRSLPPTDEEIRVRAYFLSLERRHPAADPRADWLRAEQELAGGRGATPDQAAGQS